MKTAEKITLNKAELLAAIDPCAKTALTGGHVELMRCIRFVFDGKTLELAATDGKSLVTRKIPSDAPQASFCINAVTVRNAVAAIKGEVTLNVTDSRVDISGSGSKFSLPWLDSEDFPTITDNNQRQSIGFSGLGLRSILSVLTATDGADTKTRPILGGVNFHKGEGHFNVYATNTYMGMTAKVEGDCDAEVTLSRDALTQIGKLGFSDAEEIIVEFSDKAIHVERSGDQVIAASLLGQAPGTHKVFREKSFNQWIVDKDELAAAVKTVIQFAEKGIVSLHLTRTMEGLVASCKSTANGEAESTIPCDGGIFEHRVRLNAAYVLSCCAACPSQAMEIGFDDSDGYASRAVMVNAPGSDKWSAFIAPLAPEPK